MMKLVKLIISSIVFGLMFISAAKCQESPEEDLLGELLSEESPNQNALLPERMLLTQRMLWGEKGLYRKMGIAPKVLNSEAREKELKIRRTMFKIHQGVGLATAGAMLAQGIIGSRLYNNFDPKLKNWHEGLATGINIGYGTTALMSFTSPPPFINRKKFDNIKLHKILSYVHLTGMITTNVLANRLEGSGDNYLRIRKMHKYVGLTTFGAYALAIGSIKIEF
jgi:cytochrome b561